MVVEHVKLPAASVDDAEICVSESEPSVTVRPGSANSAGVPVAIDGPLQSADAYSRTVVPASAAPFTFGVLSPAGESGVVAPMVGAAGPVESSS